MCPEIFQDGRLNIEALQTLLPDDLEDEEQQKEHFGLSWPGKTRARQLALRKPVGSTLKPCPGEGVNEESTQNIFIEGDNLEVLKLLREAYTDQVKMIYIDPPYNTGKDFVYKDKFSESQEEYLQKSGQRAETGELLVANPKSSGRFHSNWLNFIYPRLRVAKDLLKDKGVIFISIDDNEIHNLKAAMNELFGEENLVAQLTTITNLKGRNDKKNVAPCHEYILIYQKGDFTSKGLPLTAEQLKQFKYTDDNGEKYGLRDLRKRGGPDRREDRPNMYFPIYYNKAANKMSLKPLADTDVAIYPMRGDGVEGRWRWGEDTIGKYLNILHPKHNEKKGKWGVEHRVYLNPNVVTEVAEEEDDDNTTDDIQDDDQSDEVQRTSKSKSFWMTGEISTDAGKRAFKTVFPEADFSFPKSVELIKRCMNMGLEGNDIVLDFFAGSCTTAQAAFELKVQSQYKNIRFVCVQLSQPLNLQTKNKEEKKCVQYLTSVHKPLNLSEIGKERIRRSAAAVLKKAADEDPAFAEQELSKVDFGFKVYKEDASSFKVYETYTGSDVGQLSFNLTQATDKPMVEGWTKPDLTTEIMLLEGFPLHSTQIRQEQYTENELVAITSDFNENTLYVCLDAQLQDETVEALALSSDDIFVCLDSALTDLQKVRLDDKLKLKTV